MFMSKQKSHQNPTSDDLELTLLVNNLTRFNPKIKRPKSQWLIVLRGWFKWN